LNDANLNGEIFHSIAGPYKSCLCCAEAFWKSKSAAGKIDSPTFSEREMLGVAQPACGGQTGGGAEVQDPTPALVRSRVGHVVFVGLGVRAAWRRWRLFR
jgi:hypothetical protein